VRTQNGTTILGASHMYISSVHPNSTETVHLRSIQHVRYHFNQNSTVLNESGSSTVDVIPLWYPTILNPEYREPTARIDVARTRPKEVDKEDLQGQDLSR
jgi:hypothetical protein